MVQKIVIILLDEHFRSSLCVTKLGTFKLHRNTNEGQEGQRLMQVEKDCSSYFGFKLLSLLIF